MTIDPEATDLSVRRKGQRVAGFELTERIDTDAKNAFGEVWLARRLQPFQLVAIKFLRPDRVDEEMLERFSRVESKALARFNHPYIARFYELGRLGDVPYLVMQYVPGAHITSYADEHRLSIADRLRLMAKVCDAVQHVHLQGVVHRDLKPANILVGESRPDAENRREAGAAGRGGGAPGSDRGPIPVLIDFGLAKSSNPNAPLASAIDVIGGMAGTPAYASPEQISALRPEDTGQEADIYALGAVLFELIAGVSPMEHVLSDTTLSDLDRRTRLARDERPSMAEAYERLPPAKQREIAQARGVDPDAMGRLLRSRLAHLTDRALRPSPASRFRDAHTFALDIGNYLADRDYLEAAAEPRLEKWRRAARRNRVAVGAAAAVAVALVATTVIVSVALVERTRALRLAEHREDELMRVLEFQAQSLALRGTEEEHGTAYELLVDELVLQADSRMRGDPAIGDEDRARRIGDLRRQLEGINAAEVLRRVVHAAMIKPSAESLGPGLGALHPSVRALLLMSIGQGEWALGFETHARERFADALRIHEEIDRAGGSDGNGNRLLWSRLWVALSGPVDDDPADPSARAARMESAVGETLGTDTPRFLEVMRLQRDLAAVRPGELDRAIALAERVKERSAADDPRSWEALADLVALGELFTLSGDPGQAKPLLEQAVKRLDAPGAPKKLRAQALRALGYVVVSNAKTTEDSRRGIEMLRQSCEISDREWGFGHPEAFRARVAAAIGLLQREDPAQIDPAAIMEALRILEENIKIAEDRELLHPDLPAAKLQLALVRSLQALHTTGGPDLELGQRALQDTLGALAECRDELGPSHDLTLQAVRHAALQHAHWGDLGDAEQLLTEAIELRKKQGESPGSKERLVLAFELGRTLRSLGRAVEAVAMLDAAQEAARRERGEHSQSRWWVSSLLLSLLEETGAEQPRIEAQRREVERLRAAARGAPSSLDHGCPDWRTLKWRMVGPGA